jgi:hypothetical protein
MATRPGRVIVLQALAGRIVLLMVLAGSMLSAAFVLAACGGDNKRGDVAGGKTPAASAGSGSGDVGELQKAAAKFKDATFRAVYAASGAAADVPLDGVPSSVAISELVLVKDGQDKLRFDIRGTRAAAAFYLALIRNGADSYRCVPGAPATATAGSAAGVCVNTSAYPTNPVDTISRSFGNLGGGNVEIQDKSERKIAGEDATCYTVLDKDTNEVNTTCFGDDGVLLANASFEATSVEHNVSEADFNLPYPIADGSGPGR